MCNEDRYWVLIVVIASKWVGVFLSFFPPQGTYFIFQFFFFTMNRFCFGDKKRQVGIFSISINETLRKGSFQKKPWVVHLGIQEYSMSSALSNMGQLALCTSPPSEGGETQFHLIPARVDTQWSQSGTRQALKVRQWAFCLPRIWQL